MSIESLHATARMAVFGSLWGMMFSLIPCCTFWMFTETAVPREWGTDIAPNVWIAVWFLMQAFFAVLMLRAYLHPVVCGVFGAIAYLPAIVPAAATMWQFVTGGLGSGWSIADLYCLVPVALHFGLVSATAVAFVTRPRGPRRRDLLAYNDEE